MRSASGRGAGPGRAVRQASARRNVATSRSRPSPRPSRRSDSIRSRQRRGVGRVDEQHGVGEVDPSAAGLGRAPRGHRRLPHPLALDVDELAPLGRDPIGRPNLAQARGHERHGLGARQRAHAHRDRGDAIDRQEPGQPARLDLGRPAATRCERRRQPIAGDQGRADGELRSLTGDGRPQRTQFVGAELAGEDAPFLRDSREARGHPSQLGLARRVEQQVGPPQRPPRCRGDLAVQRGVREQCPLDPPALGPLLHHREVLLGVPVGRHREQLECPRDRVVEGGERLEGGRPFRLGHELEIDGRELEPRDQAAVGAEALRGAVGRRPRRRRRCGESLARREPGPPEPDHPRRVTLCMELIVDGSVGVRQYEVCTALGRGA